MPEDRGTHTITTPDQKRVVVVKDWINGREAQAIDGALYSGMETEGEGDTAKPKMGRRMIADQECASIEMIVISVDGNETDVLNQVLDMRVKDFKFVIKHLDKIADGTLDPKDESTWPTSTSKSSPTEPDPSTTTSSQ